jgi:hypothetical protein
MKFHFKGEKMIKIFKALKNAVRFFDLNPQGFSINEQKRNEQLEKLNALVKYLQVQSSRHEGLIDNLKKKQEQKVTGLLIDIMTLKDEISRLENEDKKTVTTGSTFLKTTPKNKKVIVKHSKLKSLTQIEAKNVFEYKDGELYWKHTFKSAKKGDVAGTIVIPSHGNKFRKINYGSKSYRASHIIFLIFHGYLPKRISFIDKNPLNTRIENLKEIVSRNV